MRLGFLEQRDHLFTLHARKAFEKLLDRITRFQVIEQAFFWYARARKDRFAPEHLRILCYDAAQYEERVRLNYAEYQRAYQSLELTALSRRV